MQLDGMDESVWNDFIDRELVDMELVDTGLVGMKPADEIGFSG